MSFLLPDYLKTDLKQLTDFPDDEWPEFVATLIDIHNKSKQTRKKVFAFYAEKTGIDAELLKSSAESLFLTLVEAARFRVSETNFNTALEPILLSKATVLWSVYTQHEQTLREALEELARYIPQYKSLDWRLDVQLASRACFDQLEPKFVMALDLEGVENTNQTVTFSCDIPNLVHALEVLELALSNCNNYVKKVQRSFK